MQVHHATTTKRLLENNSLAIVVRNRNMCDIIEFGKYVVLIPEYTLRYFCSIYQNSCELSFVKDHKRNFKMKTNFLSIVVSQVENKCGLNFIN